MKDNLKDGGRMIYLKSNRYANWIGKITISVLMVMTVIGCNSDHRSNDSFSVSGIILIAITAGTYQMGDVENLNICYDQKPVHQVTLSAFEMSVYEVSNEQYAAYLNQALADGEISVSGTNVMGVGGEYHDREYIALNGGHAYRNNRCWITYQDGIFIPGAGKENWLVVYVTWYGAKAFAEYFGYDLPTEAEWEYASRAGRGYQYSTLDGTIDTLKANYNFSEGHPVAVGNYPPNSFGLCNMSGNVWEWCNDFYGEYSEKEETNPRGALAGYPHILRGGAWNFSENLCSSSYRYSYWPEYSDNSIGFRVVRR